MILNMREITVSAKHDNEKICNFLLETFPNLSKSTLFKALRQKDIRINGVKINSNILIHTNDKINVYIVDSLLLGFNLDIIYEDENIIIINKPSGIEVTGENSLSSIVEEKYNAMPCHRLDRNTSGLVIFAKNKESLEILLNKFKNHEIDKYYKCEVYGIPQKSHDILNAYLFKDAKKSFVYISDTPKKGYRNIITEYTVLLSNNEEHTSILEIKLHTGRTHQIRAHLAHIGHPIIGDGKYGINDINKAFHKKTQELCAYKLIFNFNSNSGILEYLNGKVILNNIF